MDLEIPYGKEKVKIKILEDFEILIPKKVEIKNQDKLIEKALSKPFDINSFDDFVENINKLLVIVNDASRPTPTSKILKYLLPFLSSFPDLKFIIATGVHREPTEDELKFIFGETYQIFRRKIYVHNARRNEDMVYLGKSKNGTEMYINKLVTEYKNIIVIGSVEPHYFAGYTGGRKSFLPGVSSYKTIEMNHKLALKEKATSLVLLGNPVHEDMTDAMNVLKNLRVFSIQTVLTSDHKLYSVTAGDLHKSFNAAIKFSNEIFCVPLKKKGNIVITVAPYPMDIDLYQSQKALDNGKLALEENGIIILVSKCRMGIGEEAFLDLLCKADTPEKIFNILKNEYKLGYHKAAKMAEIGKWASIWAVTDLDQKIIKKAMMKPYSNLQKAVEDAIKETKLKNKKPKIIILPYGSLTIPILKGG